MASALILRSKLGSIISKSVREGELRDIIRQVVAESVQLWQAERSDFIVIRDLYPVSIKLPINKEQYDTYSKYDMQRTSNGSVMFQVPVYVISFDNEWQEEDYVDKEVIVVAPVIDSKVEEIILELAVEATKEKPKEDTDDSEEIDEGDP
ncbi:MAG: DUF2286 domain-containing protein [Candidatus Methanomethylicia archaeon]|nr:DUF2286 domain-containing protein [Candidatus Methanomethylicia archaeon]